MTSKGGSGWKEEDTEKLSRREFLKVGAAGVGVAALGSMPQQVFGAAPAIKKGTKLTILQGTYFIAPGQDLYKKQAAEWGQANGVEVSADFLNWPDLQPKIAAAIQAGGVDIVELWPSWNYLYQDNLVDMTKEAEEFGKRGGGFEKYVLNSAKMGNRWLGIPHGHVERVHGLPDQLVQGGRCCQRRGRRQGRLDLGSVLRDRQEV